MTARAVLVGTAWLIAVGGAITLMITAATTPILAASGFTAVMFGASLAIITDASVGAVLTLKRPGNVMGLLLVAAAILLVITFGGFVSGASLSEQRGKHDLLAGVASLLGPVAIFPAVMVAGPMVAVLFPDGRLPGPRWRWPLGAIAAATSIGTTIVALRPGPIGASLADNPFGIGGFSGSEPFWPLGESLAAASLPVALVLAIAAVIVRARRSDGIERAQLKWFVAANLVFVALMAVAISDGPVGPTIVDRVAPWAMSLPPIAIGVAILRYRLFEIDRIISRSLSWTVVTTLLGALFVGLVVALQAVSANITGTNTLAVAASTLVVAAAFQPLQRRIQGAVDRRFNRARYDAQRTTEVFNERLRNEVDLVRLRETLIDTVEDAFRPVTTSVWLRSGPAR